MRLSFIATLAAIACATPAFAGTKLWGDFESGMTPQQVVDVAVKIPGVSGAKIKQKKDRVEVDVSHGMYSKFEVAGKKSRLSFTFRNDKLFAVDISPEPYEFGTPGCIQGGVQAFRYYDQLLQTKYQRNYDPTPNIDDAQIDVMIARANLATLSKERYAVPVNSMAAGYTDGKVQIINRVRFSYLTVGLCGRQGNLRGSTSLSYMDKLEFEAVAKSNQDDHNQAVNNLGRDL